MCCTRVFNFRNCDSLLNLLQKLLTVTVSFRRGSIFAACIHHWLVVTLYSSIKSLTMIPRPCPFGCIGCFQLQPTANLDHQEICFRSGTSESASSFLHLLLDTHEWGHHCSTEVVHVLLPALQAFVSTMWRQHHPFHGHLHTHLCVSVMVERLKR